MVKLCLGMSSIGLSIVSAQNLQAPSGKRGRDVTSVEEHYHDQLPHFKKVRTDAGTDGCAAQTFFAYLIGLLHCEVDLMTSRSSKVA